MPQTLTTGARAWETSVGQEKTASVRRAQFEGGYAQRSATGPNSVGQNVSLTFFGSTAEIDAIDLFLTERRGVEAFYYDLMGRFTGLLFTCETWRRSIATDTHERLTATFRQEFDIP